MGSLHNATVAPWEHKKIANDVNKTKPWQHNLKDHIVKTQSLWATPVSAYVSLCTKRNRTDCLSGLSAAGGAVAKTDVTPAILSRNFVAQLYCATNLLDEISGVTRVLHSLRLSYRLRYSTLQNKRRIATFFLAKEYHSSSKRLTADAIRRT